MSDEEEQDTILPESEFNYPLLVPFKYASKSGDNSNATFILFTAPSAKVIKECSALKQAFFRAMGEQQEKDNTATDNDEKEVVIEGHDIIQLISTSSSVDLPEILDIAKKLFTAPGIALIDGESKFTDNNIGRVSYEDFELMLGHYLVNFILASSLNRLQNKSTK